MSKENVELVRQSINAFNRGDLDGALAAASPDIRWEDQPELPGATVHEGAEATAEHLRAALRDLPGYQIHPEEFVEIGTNVVVSGRISAQGRASGAPVERPYFACFGIEEGRIRRVRFFGSRSEVLDAIRVSE